MGKNDLIALPPRLAGIKAKLDSVLEADARNVELASYMFMDDQELLDLGLKRHEIARVRSWETSKKDVAAGLSASASRMEAMLRLNEDKGTTVNIERAIIQIPEPGAVPQQSLRDAVVIDVEPGK